MRPSGFFYCMRLCDITTLKGGVGLMTITMLMANTMRTAKLVQNRKQFLFWEFFARNPF